MDATLPVALPSDAPLPTANVMGSLPLPHAATLPPTVVVNAPPAAVGVFPATALPLPLPPAGTTATSVSAPSVRGGRGHSRGGGHAGGRRGGCGGRSSAAGRGGRQPGIRNYCNNILIDIIDETAL